MYQKGSARPVKALKILMGPPFKHNSFEAEATGAILAIWIAGNTAQTFGKQVSLYIDNQSIIYALSRRNFTSGQYPVDALRTAPNDLHCHLTVRQVFSHSEVKGNEKADRSSKEAAGGRTSRRADLPHILRNQLPASASTIKQDFHKSPEEKWQTTWTTSPRRTRFSQIDPNFPFHRFRKDLFKQTRKQASLIMQIRTGHIPFNKYLKRIRKTGSDRCREHRAGRQLSTRNGQPLLIRLSSSRRELVAKIGRQHLNHIDIMKN